MSDFARWSLHGAGEARAGNVVERGLSRLAAEGMLARWLRLGSLRAGSQVIRAHLVWRVNDERGRARITCSLRPCLLIRRLEQSERAFGRHRRARESI